MHSEERVPEGDNKFSALASLWIRSAVHRLWTSSTRPYPYRTNGRCKYFSLSLSTLFFLCPFHISTDSSGWFNWLHPSTLSLISKLYFILSDKRDDGGRIIISLSLSLSKSLPVSVCVCETRLFQLQLLLLIFILFYFNDLCIRSWIVCASLPLNSIKIRLGELRWRPVCAHALGIVSSFSIERNISPSGPERKTSSLPLSLLESKLKEKWLMAGDLCL